MRDVTKKVEGGAPSGMKKENKNEPPHGLSLGGDDRKLGKNWTRRLIQKRAKK